MANACLVVEVGGGTGARRRTRHYCPAMSNVIPHNWEVPKVFRDRLGSQAGRQRTMTADGHILIILHEAPKAEVADRTARLFWRKPDGTWKATGSNATTIAALKAHVEEYGRAEDAMEARAAAATRAADWFELIHDSAPLLRASRGMHAALQEAREHAKTDNQVIALRDAAQDIERTLELINTHAKSGLDFAIAKGTEEAAKNSEHVLQSGHRLNLIMATFLPITALGSLFGMQLEHGLEKEHAPYIFWGVAIAAFLLGLIVRGSLPKQKPTT
jgi:Mg2+ and Co2+ transporter CorA